MAAFIYRAVDAAGRQRRGVIEAGSASGARQTLRERSLLPLSVEATSASGVAQEASAGAPVSRLNILRRLRPALGAGALSLVTRQLSTLVGSDVRVEDALRTVSQQSTSPRAASVLLNVRAAILDGRTFAGALGDHPAAFPEYYRASVAAGEQSGRLGAVLLHLADFVEARQRNRQKVQLALLYPALLAVVSIGIMTMLLTYVVPDIARAFLSRGADLPLLTRGLIALSGAMNAYGWILALALAVVAVCLRQWMVRPASRLAIDRLIAENPLTSGFSRQTNAAQFAGTLATLVQSGVPLVEALSAASAVTPNRFLRAKIAIVASRVREGASLRAAVGEAACFPPLFVAMVASGETSGTLGTALARAADDQQRQLDGWVSTLVALVEPAILLLMGGLVLLMVLSILLPIVSLNDLAGVRR